MKLSSLVLIVVIFFGALSVGEFVWSASIAEQYLFYSYASYCDSDKVSSWTCKWCNESSVSEFTPVAFPYDRKVGGYGFIGVHEPNKTIVVAFRGSTDIQNYIIDLESVIFTPYKNYSGIEVGLGFYTEWNDLLPDVIPVVEDLVEQYPDYEIWVTGHSLGAAISILCAAELAQEGFQNISVYNYGLPRVGNQAFSQFYSGLVPNTYRIVNGHDIVPHLPFYSMGFYHVPTEVWENPAESYSFRICDGSGEDPNCSDSQTLDLSVYDHLHYLGYYEDCTDDD